MTHNKYDLFLFSTNDKYLKLEDCTEHYLGHIKKQEVTDGLKHFKELTQTAALFLSSSVLCNWEKVNKTYIENIYVLVVQVKYFKKHLVQTINK